jgi:hypothetical protein
MDELSGLEHRIKVRILQIKTKMHETRERAATDRLWSEIETLNWVSDEILRLRFPCRFDYQLINIFINPKLLSQRGWVDLEKEIQIEFFIF